MFLLGLLESEGSKKNKILEKISKKPNYVRNQDIALKIIMCVFQLVLCLAPIFAFLNFYEVYGQIDNYQLLFSLSALVTAVFIFQIFCMFIFGINLLIEMLGVDSFTYLKTLPISRKDTELIASKILGHGFKYQMISIFMTLPLGTTVLMIIFKQFLILPLIISFVKSFVVTYITMWLSVKISVYFVKMYSKYSSDSKKTKNIRSFFGLLYKAGAIGTGMIMRLTFVYITENSTATISVLPETTKVNLTLIFSMIPILFSESYLYTLSFVPFADIDLRILILSILGTIIAILLAM